MNKAHLMPAVFFGALLITLLVANGVSPVHALLGACGAYCLVSLVEFSFDMDAQTSAADKR